MKTKMPTQHEVMRKVAHEATVAALADGRKVRSARFADRRKVAAKRACRDRARWSD
jgi:hypothetical protein